MSRFSKAEAEAAGWSIVYQRDEFEVEIGPGLVQTTPATYVAEKYVSKPGIATVLIHEEADSIGKLLERIHLYEQTQGNDQEPEEFPVDTSQEHKLFSPLYEDDGDGELAKSVIIPTEPGDLTLEAPTTGITDAEWSARGRSDVLVVGTDDGGTKQVSYAGGNEDVIDAEELRTLNKKAIEDRRSAEAAVGPVEQVQYDTAQNIDSPGQSAGGVLVVREGEDSFAAIGERKEALKKMREEGRVESQFDSGFEAVAPEGADKLAGVDVGIQERSDLGSDIPPQGSVARILEDEGENVAPSIYPEGSLPEIEAPDPDELTQGEAESEARAAAKEIRDEDGTAEAESDEGKHEVREVGIEAAEEAADAAKEGADEASEEPEPTDDGEEVTEQNFEVTDAARAKAEELGVDLTQVEGTGKDGRITAPDVEAAAEPESE